MKTFLRKIRLNLSTQILLGLTLGIFSGLFFGETVAWLDGIGQAFLRLFQMPVIPYIMVSLILSLGRLNYKEAKSIFIKGGLILGIFWAIVLIVVALFSLGFPAWKSASFFSTSLIEATTPFNFLSLFLPSNPFNVMASGTIPAIVFFSITLGLAIIPLPNKKGLIDILSNLSDSLMGITKFVAKLTPIGVFAISANAAGTLSIEAFTRLQIYIILQALCAILLSFWVLPALVATLTPLRYSEVVKAYRAPLITAFATANLLIVLPLIIEKSKELLNRLQVSNKELEINSPLAVIVPVSFTFPSMGKLLSLCFIPFAAWYGGYSLSLEQYLQFSIAGLAGFFGDGITAMQFLLNLTGMPIDMLKIFVTLDQISAARFGTLLAGMNTVALALLTTCGINGLISLRKKRLLRFVVISIGLLLLLLGGVHLGFTYGVKDIYSQDKTLSSLQLLRVRNPSEARILKPESVPIGSNDLPKNHLKQIQDRGRLRVCYLKDNYPLSYLNTQGELVGFDIEMAHILARDLGVRIDFITMDSALEITSTKIAQTLNEGYCDIFMSLTAITPQRAFINSFSAPVTNFTLAFLVLDRRQQEFANWGKMMPNQSLRIGIAGQVLYYEAKIKGLLPKTKIVKINSLEEFLDSKSKKLDGVAWAAETGAAWTLLYPDYSIAIPKPIIAAPMAYPLPLGDRHWGEVIDSWLKLKQLDGTIKSLFDYWIQGKVEKLQEPRWSIIRNVLHWID